MLVIQHFEGAPGIFVTIPYVTVLVTGAIIPATWLMIVMDVPQGHGKVAVVAVPIFAADA